MIIFKMRIFDRLQRGSRIASIASQFIACVPQYLLLLDLGMAVTFTTIAIPDLLNAKEGLSLDEHQASWFGSLSFLTQPLGALFSGPIVDYFGRKKANFLVNLPHVAGWVLMYFAWDLPSLFIANALLGLGTGVMEAPINSYAGEISEPSTRGPLCTVTLFFSAIGISIMCILGSVFNWRYAALVCLAAPITSMITVILAPETPVWLLAKGRDKDALKSLCRLRGWTSSENVKDEYQSLSIHCKKLQQCVICDIKNKGDDDDCEHKSMNFLKRYILRMRYVMLCKETLRPLTLVIMYFFFYVMSGLEPLRANMANVCGALGMAQDGKQILVYVGGITLITNLLVIGLIKVLGKRKLAIPAMMGTAIACMGLSIYARANVADSVFSYDTTTFPTEKSNVPLILFYLIIVFTGFGIPWVILAEVFPFRSRATSQSLAAAVDYIIIFIGSKTFIDLESGIHLWGALATYAAFGFAGALYLYFFLPETENKTLQEIESYYSGEFRIFADNPCIRFFAK